MEKNRYRLKITPIASQDLDEIYSYIATELFNGNAAENLMGKIEKSIMGLKDFPLSYNFVADEILRQKGYRKLVIDNYIAFYIVNEEEKQVVIMRVLNGRQKYEDIV